MLSLSAIDFDFSAELGYTACATDNQDRSRLEGARGGHRGSRHALAAIIDTPQARPPSRCNGLFASIALGGPKRISALRLWFSNSWRRTGRASETQSHQDVALPAALNALSSGLFAIGPSLTVSDSPRRRSIISRPGRRPIVLAVVCALSLNRRPPCRSRQEGEISRAEGSTFFREVPLCPA